MLGECGCLGSVNAKGVWMPSARGVWMLCYGSMDARGVWMLGEYGC